MRWNLLLTLSHTLPPGEEFPLIFYYYYLHRYSPTIIIIINWSWYRRRSAMLKVQRRVRVSSDALAHTHSIGRWSSRMCSTYVIRSAPRVTHPLDFPECFVIGGLLQRLSQRWLKLLALLVVLDQIVQIAIGTNRNLINATELQMNARSFSDTNDCFLGTAFRLMVDLLERRTVRMSVSQNLEGSESETEWNIELQNTFRIRTRSSCRKKLFQL